MIPLHHLGEAAALSTALLWAFTAVFFTLAGTRVGALAVNRTRLVIAVCLLACAHAVALGVPWPRDASPRHWFWFGLSGVIGLALGDSFLFQALLDIGPRKAMLVMASWPIFSALLALAFLGETLTRTEAAGVALTVAGITWVILERNPVRGPASEAAGGHPIRGFFNACGGAFCQAAGIVVARRGLDGAISPLSGTLIRMLVATLCLWIFTLAARRLKDGLAVVKDRKALVFTTAGAVTGPFLGVWLSLVAVQHAKVGVASALMALVPILILPLVRIVFHERVSPRALLGTLATIGGVILLLGIG